MTLHPGPPGRPVLSSFGNTTCRVKTEVTKGLFDHLFIVKRAAASCSFRPLSLSLSLSFSPLVDFFRIELSH